MKNKKEYAGDDILFYYGRLEEEGLNITSI